MCDDAENGGIENCKLCKGNNAGDKIECKECKKGYILLRDNDKYECLNREIFDETNKFGSCLELEKKNDNYICVRCKIQYSLLNANDISKSKCVYTPTLFDILMIKILKIILNPRLLIKIIILIDKKIISHVKNQQILITMRTILYILVINVTIFLKMRN